MTISDAPTGIGSGNGNTERFVVESEFALIEVSLDRTANGPRVAIRDLKSGSDGYLDPLELESLVYVRHEALTKFMDPGSTRWAGPFDSK